MPFHSADVHLKDEVVLEENCQHQRVQYLNKVPEDDHRGLKRRVRARESASSRSFGDDLRATAGLRSCLRRAPIPSGPYRWPCFGLRFIQVAAI